MNNCMKLGLVLLSILSGSFTFSAVRGVQTIRSTNTGWIGQIDVHNLNAPIFYNGTSKPALFWAIANDNAELVRDLIDAGADIDITDNMVNTPLIAAVKKGNRQIAQILVRAGADQSCRDFFGNTALKIADHAYDFLMVYILDDSLIFDKNKKIELETLFGQTVLHAWMAAVQNEPAELAEMLFGKNIPSVIKERVESLFNPKYFIKLQAYLQNYMQRQAAASQAAQAGAKK